MRIPFISSLFPFIPSLFGTRPSDAGCLAIDLAEHGVYLAQVVLSGTMPRVVRCEYHEIGTVSAVSMDKLRREAHLGGYLCSTLLSPGEYQMVLIEAPNVPDDEIKTAIRWKVKDSLSYRIDNATVDAVQMPFDRTEMERAQSLYAVAASNDTIRKRMTLFDQAKIKLGVIDIPDMAQRNIAALFEQEGRALAMLAFNENGALVTFTAGGELYMSRRIEISVGQLQDANDNLRNQCLDRVELELQRSLDYFDRQFNHLLVNRILVSAPESTGITELLTATMGSRVEQLDLAQVMDVSAVPALADSEFATYALLALGAALRHEGCTP